MIVGHVVWDKIQHQPNAARRHFPACHSKPMRAAEIRIHLIPAHAVGRPDIVPRFKIGQHLAEFSSQRRVLIRNQNSRRTPFPYPHQPHHVHPQISKPIPFTRRNVCQTDLRP